MTTSPINMNHTERKIFTLKFRLLAMEHSPQEANEIEDMICSFEKFNAHKKRYYETINNTTGRKSAFHKKMEKLIENEKKEEEKAGVSDEMLRVMMDFARQQVDN